ncbi:MAG: glycosyltransferase family 10 [Pirellulaceae bacterium]
MPNILIAASFPPELLLRQTPASQGCWGDFRFVTDPGQTDLAGCVVYDDLVEPLELVCPAGNTLLITGEPESLRSYRSRFTHQFGQVWTSHESIQHARKTRRNEAQHWHYGLYAGQAHGRSLDFDNLVTLPRPKKSKRMSVICSAKAHSEDHRQRLVFVEQLKEALGDSIDVFGRGVRSIDDKSDAIYDYQYHIVLENDHSDFFMTEKLADAFLGYSYPIYFGGPEAYHRYPEGSFTSIDIYRPAQAIATIRAVLEADCYANSRGQLDEARRRVLYDNNLCSMLAEHFSQTLVNRPAQRVRLVPKKHRAELVWKLVQKQLRRNAA